MNSTTYLNKNKIGRYKGILGRLDQNSRCKKHSPSLKTLPMKTR
jgi:hypothetical protein